ncbi:MAG: hypothetical protein ABSE28_14300 [Candidatus Sulfotelmatobacter sp.]|jgi:hypothetical protein
MKRMLVCGLAICLSCLPASSQQTDINRYTLFTGFDYMISPARNLTERGFESDFGVTVRSWLGLGGDFGVLGNSVISGAGTINGSETVYAPLLIANEPIAPAPGMVNVPFKSTTYTFAVGPQFYLRKWEKVTLFARPGFGGIHESADITFPQNLAPLFGFLQVPLPAAKPTDTELFFGAGGGFDLNVSRQVGVRFAADWVNTHLFSNLLSNRQNYVRSPLGPPFAGAD